MKIFTLFLIFGLSFLGAKELKMAFGYDKPPYIFSKNSTFGVEPDLIKSIFKPLGYKVEIVQMAKYYLDNILQKSNNYDGVIFLSNKKSDNLCYSDNLFYYQNYAITRLKEDIKIDSIDDLKRVDFVSWSNSYQDLGDEFYRLFNPRDGKFKEKYHQNPSQLEDVKLFFRGDVKAILIDKRIFEWYKEYFHIDEEFEYHPIFPKKSWYGVAFRDKKLCYKFNNSLKKIKQNGTYEKILNYYFNYKTVPVLQLVDVLTEVIAPSLYRLDKALAKKILEIFMENDDILSIKIIDSNLNKKFLEISKQEHQVPSKMIKRDILYKSDSGIVKLGELKVEYKIDFKSSTLLPSIDKFYGLRDINIDYIYKIYNQNMVITTKKLPLTKKEREFLDDLDFISVHNEKSWAPYNFNENGQAKGYVVDYIKLLGRKLNKKINFVSGYSWNEFLELIKNNRIDVISNIIYTKKREKYINFTEPYLVIKKAIFSNQPNLKHLSDLEGKRVAVPEGFFIQEYLAQHYPKIKIKTYKNILDSIVAVLNKEADAIVESYNIINYLLQKNNLSIKYMSISEDKGLISKIRLGVTKSKPILRDILQKAIDSVTKEELAQLRSRWSDIKKRQVTQFSEEEDKYLRSVKKIKVCSLLDEIPVEFKRDNSHLGISIDVLNIVTSKLAKETIFVETKSLKQSIKYLQSGKCDLIPSIINTEKMEKDLWFTKPYLIYKLALITRDDSPIITDIKTLSNRVLAQKRGSAIINLIKDKYKSVRILEVDSYKEALEMVKSKKAYFTILPLPTLAYFKYQRVLRGVKISGYLDSDYSLSMAIPKENYLLYGIIEKTLESIPKNTFKIVNDKWTTKKVVEMVDYKMVFVIILISLIIISTILLVYWRQKRLHNRINELNRTLEIRVQEEILKNREREKMLLYQDRLAKMGELISMIAHQWRQPLNNLSLIIQMFIFKYEAGELDDEVVKKFKKDTFNQINLMSTTIDNFKDFFRPEKSKQTFNLKELIVDMLELLRPIIKNSKIKIELDIDNEIMIYGYRNELGQSIFNIINNAKDALNNRPFDTKVIKIYATSDKSSIKIFIEDNAGGIDEKILDKIFEPYFSTKDSKNGTGLGLYMSKIIIEEYMSGKITVSNGKSGAIFMIELSKELKKE